ncbi:hypothetical protein F2Q69_00046259 [Brassica cretica]|uniref:Uncharacterized protein n=1 Tax=Brassica cretica TaxID=69181 RepID=A0A8S9Q1F6_BRACR|nr:hypothetical protein F2Q69_00046259 [Brassica cretica]
MEHCVLQRERERVPAQKGGTAGTKSNEVEKRAAADVASALESYEADNGEGYNDHYLVKITIMSGCTIAQQKKMIVNRTIRLIRIIRLSLLNSLQENIKDSEGKNRRNFVGISSEYRYSDDIPTKHVVGNNSSEFIFSSEIPRNFPSEFRGNSEDH